ncbi:hypothetical protein SAMN05428949_2178 [Chitinophaga sp. YR627]|uniref:hypothetical protein n=1 Tax=Chitinophaga sp. YR627 TaxID=1881041 RepID=UPI0008E9AD03|nr:hypothetical protein [Chitinophaga sp. YR627]SFN26451.1 hypothetical protein SAMN05428949_2178 [Chitinophaga sp. YR627]
MKDKLPYITSTYFISLIKSYLQGHKTKPEILAETADLLPVTAHKEVSQFLTAAAHQMNDAFYADIVDSIQHTSGTVPTRKGLIHHLEALLSKQISIQELLDWATWYTIEEDQLSAGIMDDFAVEYFCFDFLPAHYEELTDAQFTQVLQLFRATPENTLKEKIALALIIEKERQHFLYFLRSFLEQPQHTDALNTYLMAKFGMDHRSFPYIQELMSIQTQPEKLEALLEKARLSAV